MTVYHGSHTMVEKPEIRLGRNTKDFGPGFYCTVIREQAVRWARRYDTPYVNSYTVRLDDSLRILEFKEMTEEWLDFMIACRHGEKQNDLFYTCSLIEYIARKTKNHRAYVVDCLGKKRLSKIYELADIYHSDNIERVSEDFIEEAGIADGDFDNVAVARYAVPSYWDIGKVYKRLVMGIEKEKKLDRMDALIEAYHSFVCEIIDDYNGSFFYENPQNILNVYLTGEIE